MLAKSKGLLVLLCVLSLSFSMAHAENLFVIENGDTHVNDVVAIDGVNVYAVMEAGLFAGISGAGETALSSKGLAFEGVGQRMSGEYYLFQIERNALNSLHPSAAVVYYDGKEAIVNIQNGIDLSRNNNVKGLTRISFVPKPIVENKAGYQRGDMLIDPEIQQIVDQVTEAQFTNWIQTMQDFVTRYSYTSSCRAAEQWAVNTFDSYGYDTELWAYSGEGGNTWYNAIGRKVGTVYPDSIYIIIGHLDAISEDPYNDAPGAEDNASGTACVLEAARVMQGYDFDCTIEFICVTGEEQGLYGSEAYAQWCYSNNRNIGGVLNFDMISYAGGYGWDTNIFSDQNFAAEVALADLLSQTTDEYSDAVPDRINTDGPEYGSDHYYFSYYGFPAPFSIDAELWYAPDWYPWYHTTDDVISNLDLDFGTEVVKGAVACLATVANLSIPPVLEFNYPNGLPELIDPDGGTTFRVEVT
ncbi:MAG: M20/M25/M40 family metallo-hydrolase, partial [candidate division Zixibacteria bacterium]|nr:M20/M25/M40 family metallo-hydrolase [candidate division Zixibacteria bacterium]